MPLEMITDSNSSILLFTGFLHVNIVAHHRLQTIVEQCIKYLIHASAIRDFKLVIALVLYIVHMASDSGADHRLKSWWRRYLRDCHAHALPLW